MGTIWIRELRAGLDTRRMPLTSPGGVLIEAVNGHITRGGEFEQRAAFVPVYRLPYGTVGLAYNRLGLVVFGTKPQPPGIPTGVLYRRLQHPSGLDITRILSFDVYAGNIYVVAEFTDGSRYHFYSSTVVDDWFDGRARASFRVVGGHESGEPSGSSRLDSLTINGVAAIVPPVRWTRSNTATAEAIADAVNDLTSNPEYVATVAGDTVNIIASNPGTASNGLTVAWTVANGMQLSPASPVQLAGGAASSTSFSPGTFVKTIGTKVYCASGPNLHFSGIQAPTKWQTGTTGAGFIDMSTETSGAQELVAIERYQGYIAVFAEDAIVIYYVDPDPALNKQVQILSNTGTSSPNSVTQFGDADIFYLDESGLRSLRARDSSNAAATEDIGVPVDSLIVAAISGLTDAERQSIFGDIEPRDGRFWLTIKDRVFVFSYFPGSETSAWTVYEANSDDIGFNIEYMVARYRRVFVRSGDTIYAYGGLDAEPVHDDTVAVATLPFLNADQPTVAKTWTGIDGAVEGTWDVFASMDPAQPEVSDFIGTFTGSTFDNGRVGMIGRSTHISLTLKSRGVGPHKIGSLVIHYEGGADED